MRSPEQFTPLTLSGLAEGQGVLASCNPCNRHIVVSGSALAERLGGDWPVPKVSERLVCSKCNGRDIATRPDWKTYSMRQVVGATIA